jgi:hypothetical protein
MSTIHPSGNYVTLAIEPRFRVCHIRDLTILGRQRDGNGYQYNRSLKRIEKVQYMNNLDICPRSVYNAKSQIFTS